MQQGTARLMYNSFGSSLWLMPFSKHCKANSVYWKHFFEGRKGHNHAHQCEESEFQSNYSGWPTDIIKIEIPSLQGADAYPSVSELAQDVTSEMECGRPVQMSFSAREVSDGTFFRAIEDYDPDTKKVLYQLQKFYQSDLVLNPLTPWDRPPLKNIFCIYGIDSKTEVGYYFAPSGKPYPDNWIITDVVFECEGTLFTRSGNSISISRNPEAPSGDATVPYNSLSWCKTWLGSKVNITRAPQVPYNSLSWCKTWLGSKVNITRAPQLPNVEHIQGEDVLPNMRRAPHVKYITYYEDAESIPGRRTAVWELDKANHRNIIRSPALMRELWLQMWHDMHPDAKSKFVTKAKRGPLRDDDCYWDYRNIRCAWPEYCEYRYNFRDLHFGQSCRLKGSRAELLQHYL